MMKKIRSLVALAIAVLLGAALLCGAALKAVYADSASANAGEKLAVSARSALLVDYHTGTVVYEYNPTQHLPIASMVKIMTLGIIFDEIEKGGISFDTDVTASANAGAMGGSQAFLDANATYKAGELIKSIIVASANDSCVAMAEHIAGSTEEFVTRMNDKAAALGMSDTHFVNCTGLPAPGAYSCARDVGTMTRELLRHDGFYQFSTVWMFDFVHPGGRFTSLSNTNKLLKGYAGCDGGKTGFTTEAMYCLSATAKRG
ncbi:MAG: D-alanyl-D-alanine carboxypeptidase, partial [Firmicutes bacterium]|nr:D-alanyl-D-alanine carboxypeptidase [Bacillota bacterium]